MLCGLRVGFYVSSLLRCVCCVVCVAYSVCVFCVLVFCGVFRVWCVVLWVVRIAFCVVFFLKKRVFVVVCDVCVAS